MQSAEIELKFAVTDVQQLRAAATQLGFTLLTERTFESNTLYDTPDRQLRARKQILRLRQYGDLWTVTHKRQQSQPATQDSAAPAAPRYKTRIETESVIEDGHALAEIFTQLGYSPVFRYEKFRTEWVSGDGHLAPGVGQLVPGAGHLVLDETPIGVWAELEGAPAWIDAMLEQLKVPPNFCSTDSYGALFLKWKTSTGSPAEDLTFAEIAAVPAL